MTSIHPPLWWNGPLGPLTSGRDLYKGSLPLHELVCRLDRRREVDEHDLLAHSGLLAPPALAPPHARAPLDPAPRAPPLGVP